MNDYLTEPKKKEFSKVQAAGLGLGAAAVVGAGTFAALKLRKSPSLIQKYIGKNLNPVFAYDKDVVGKKFTNKMIVKGHGIDMVDVKNMKKTFNPKKDIYMGQRYASDEMKNAFHRKGAINAHGKISNISNDKLLYAQKTKAVSPKSWGVSKSEAAKIKAMKTPKDVLNYLNNKHKNGYIYKARVEEDVLGSNKGQKQLIHSSINTNNKFLKQFHKTPEKYFGQEKLDILNEYRVTIAGNKVIAITDRYGADPLKRLTKALNLGAGDGMGLVPYSRTLNKELYRFGDRMAKAHRKGSGEKKLEILNLDMASIGPSGKKFKLIEPNIGPSGGQLDNPILSHMLKKQLMGMETTPMAIAKSIPGAIAAGGITYAAIPKEKKEEIYAE